MLIKPYYHIEQKAGSKAPSNFFEALKRAQKSEEEYIIKMHTELEFEVISTGKHYPVSCSNVPKFLTKKRNTTS